MAPSRTTHRYQGRLQQYCAQQAFRCSVTKVLRAKKMDPGVLQLGIAGKVIRKLGRCKLNSHIYVCLCLSFYLYDIISHQSVELNIQVSLL